jgi:hypothetical protein
MKKRGAERRRASPVKGARTIRARNQLTSHSASHPGAFPPDPAGDQCATGGVPSGGEPARLCIDPQTGKGEVSPVRDEASREERRARRLAARAGGSEAAAPVKRSFMDRVEAFVSRLSTRNNFWHRVCSLIWLPYAFKSGIRMKRIDANAFSAVLPFRRFNRNWYNAMAGAALLANSEVAGGMYVFGICGGDYEVVCKNLEYRFLRPCFGPAIYRITPREDVRALVASGSEFNIKLDLDVVQQIGKPGAKDKRVGRCVVTFHVTPKAHQKVKGRRAE